MPFTCMRMIATTFALSILFAVCIVSFEIDFWSWGIDTHPLKHFFAYGVPLRPQNPSKLAELIAEIDLPKDGEEHHVRELHHNQQNDNSPQLVKIDKEGPLQVQQSTNDSSSYSQSNNATEKFFDSNIVKAADSNQQQLRITSQQNPAGSVPIAKEFDPATKSESKTLESSHAEGASSPSTHPQISPQRQSSSSDRRSRAKSFLVVFMGHSGSTAFITELRTHPDFIIELLEPLEHGDFEFDTDKALDRARKLMDRGIENGKIPGFKIRPFHVTNKPELWREFVKEYDTRIIWQYRENIIKQAIGEYRNRFLNDTSVVEGLMTDVEPCRKDSGQICRFKIDNFRGLHALMNDFSTSDELLTETVRLLRRTGNMQIVKYEDYLYNRERTMRDAFDFLGVEYQDTVPQRRKASPDNLCEMVSNFQEVCDHFMLCQLWRHFLTDDRNGCRCKPGNWQYFDPSFCQRDAWHQQLKKERTR